MKPYTDEESLARVAHGLPCEAFLYATCRSAAVSGKLKVIVTIRIVGILVDDAVAMRTVGGGPACTV